MGNRHKKTGRRVSTPVFLIETGLEVTRIAVEIHAIRIIE